MHDALPLLRAAAVRTRGAAVAFVVLLELLLLPHYGDFENWFGHRFVAGYHVHHRVEHSIGPADEPPVMVVSTHATHWYGTATIWAVRVGLVVVLFGAPFLTWRALSPKST